MKKILSLLLALSMALSLFAVAASAADGNPTIVSAVAINDTQFKIITNEPVKITNTATFAIFLEKDGVIDNLNERSNVSYKDTGTRYGGTIAPGNEFTTEFIWAVNPGVDATDAIGRAIAAGYSVYFGLNGASSAKGVGADRAADADGNGFVANIPDNHAAHDIYAVPVKAFSPMTIQSVKVLNAKQLEIEFSEPIGQYDPALFVHFGLLNEAGTDTVTFDSNSLLDDTWELTNEEIKDGKLICYVTSTKAGMTAADGGQDLNQVIAKLKETYPDYTVGVRILETNTASAATNINGTGYLESIVSADGALCLKGTAQMTASNNRDIAAAPISTGVADVNGMIYYSIEEALQNTTAGKTLVLNEDATVTDEVVILPAGATLDLNGCELTVDNYMLAFGSIVDSSNGGGKLIIAKDNVKSILADNACLPLFDGNGYRFFDYEFRHVEKETGNADTVQYSVGLGFANKSAYALLLAEDLDFGVTMTIVKADGSKQYITWIFSDALMNEFVERNAVTKSAITLTISGMAGLGDATVSAQAVLTSQNRVVNLAKDMVAAQ